MTKAALYRQYETHLSGAEDMKKHVATRQYHATMAQFYYQMWKDAAWDGSK